MLNYTKIANKPRIFQSFTGLTLAAFGHLLTAFGQAEEQAWQHQEANVLTRVNGDEEADASQPWSGSKINWSLFCFISRFIQPRKCWAFCLVWGNPKPTSGSIA